MSSSIDVCFMIDIDGYSKYIYNVCYCARLCIGVSHTTVRCVVVTFPDTYFVCVGHPQQVLGIIDLPATTQKA